MIKIVGQVQIGTAIPSLYFVPNSGRYEQNACHPGADGLRSLVSESGIFSPNPGPSLC